MKTVSLSGSPRGNVGKKDASSLRKAGRVPAVLYGGDQQVHFHVGDIDIEKIVYTPDTYQIELDLDGTTYKSIIKDIQFHPVTDKIVHIDFLQLFDDKAVNINLPVTPVGKALGVINGGIMMVNFRKLTVRGLPGDIPEDIQVDVTRVKIGQGVRIGDISVANCEILQNPMDMAIAVKNTRAAMSAESELDEEEGEGEEGEEGAEGGEGDSKEGGEE